MEKVEGIYKMNSAVEQARGGPWGGPLAERGGDARAALQKRIRADAAVLGALPCHAACPQ